MDKTGIIVISLCAVALGFWFVEQTKYAKQQELYDRTNQLAQARLAARSNAIPGTTTATAAATVTIPVAFDTNQPEHLLALTNAQSRYTFTSRGGGLKLAELLDYPQTVSARWQTATVPGPTASPRSTRWRWCQPSRSRAIPASWATAVSRSPASRMACARKRRSPMDCGW